MDIYMNNVELPVFSKRIGESYEQIALYTNSLDVRVRNRIQHICEAFNAPIDPDSPSQYTEFYHRLWSTLQIEHGWLGHANAGRVPEFRGVPEIFQRGHDFIIFDILELYARRHLPKEEQCAFIAAINGLFIEERIQYRFADTYIVRIDSEYFANEVLSQASELINNHRFEQASTHFASARKHLTNGDWSACNVECSNCVEAVIKTIIGKNVEKQDEQLKKLRAIKIVPDYFDGFWESFVQFPHSVFIMRAKSGGHGKSEGTPETHYADNALGTFALNVTGALVIFLVTKYCEANPSPAMPPSPVVNLR